MEPALYQPVQVFLNNEENPGAWKRTPEEGHASFLGLFAAREQTCVEVTLKHRCVCIFISFSLILTTVQVALVCNVGLK